MNAFLCLLLVLLAVTCSAFKLSNNALRVSRFAIATAPSSPEFDALSAKLAAKKASSVALKSTPAKAAAFVNIAAAPVAVKPVAAKATAVQLVPPASEASSSSGAGLLDAGVGIGLGLAPWLLIPAFLLTAIKGAVKEVWLSYSQHTLISWICQNSARFTHEIITLEAFCRPFGWDQFSSLYWICVPGSLNGKA